MEVTDFEWDPQGIEDLFKSEEVNDLCYQSAVEHQPISEAWIESHRHGPSKGHANTKAKTKRLRHTCIGLVAPANRIAADIAYEHGMK